MSAITRFAPSPTGYLHLGHVANAIYVWGMGRTLGADILLRIEDHDRIRCRPEFEHAILEDLTWLGFTTENPRFTRQSERQDLYADALERLRRSHHVYFCDCSRKHIGGERYDGRCRTRGLGDDHGHGIRVRIDPGSETFRDMRLGVITQSPADQCGDLLLRDRDGHWTYQFAATVDDLLQQVDLVIRGEDLLPSTGRQLRLARMLGRVEMPTYLHHPLIVKRPGEKLSKASGDTGIRELRRQGVSAAEVLGRAAAAVGLAASATPIAARDVLRLFRPG